MNTEETNPDAFLPLHNNWFHILLSLVGNEQHGYGILQEVLERTNGTVRIWPATLYGALPRMIADGLIEESEEPGSLRPDLPGQIVSRASVRGSAASLCAGHAQQLGGASPPANLMEVKA